MKCTCKQCGKEFELSDSEIDFYRKKNLNLPKRCKECRQANKKEQESRIQYPNSSDAQNYIQNQHNMIPKQTNNRTNKWTYALIAGCILLIAGSIGLLLRSYIRLNNPAESVYSIESVQSEPIGFIDSAPEGITDSKESPQDENADLPESVQGDEFDAAETLQDENIDVTEQIQSDNFDAAEHLQSENADEAELPQSEAVDSAESAQGEAPVTRQYVFRNANLLNDHFQKHGIEMGFSSAEEYQAAASSVVNNANALHKLEAEDGDDVYYLEATNEFVIVSTDGYIRTYFCPDSGIEYYNKQ